jgi:hypothetical protein
MTFPGVNIDYKVIDEDDFPLGIHGMKYHFIKDARRRVSAAPRIYDFAYWGSDKSKLPNGKPSGDERHLVLKEIQDSELATIFWGRIRGVSPSLKWQTRFEDLLPLLTIARSTLCFNWLSDTAITARYAEALACGQMPFVWGLYDKKNRVVADDWQRVWGADEVSEKLEDRRFGDILRQLTEDYESQLPSQLDYVNRFTARLNQSLR